MFPKCLFYNENSMSKRLYKSPQFSGKLYFYLQVTNKVAIYYKENGKFGIVYKVGKNFFKHEYDCCLPDVANRIAIDLDKTLI